MAEYAPNYERPAFSPVPKLEARIVHKTKTRRKKVRMDVTEKEKVRQRDQESCRVCGRKTRDVHERLFKSLGGVASLENSLCACRTCHPFLQQHGVKVFERVTVNPVRTGCNADLVFQMSPAVARMIFGARALPAHCELVDVKPEGSE